MALKPWRSVVDPREDLRKGESLDAAEFAVHLDQVTARRGNAIYWQPEQFFARTFLTKNLLDFAGEAVRRLSGITTGASAGFNMTTQFGGGKTPALTLLDHLSTHGPEANAWFGVPQILERAGVPSVPRAATAVFVGMRFDPRGGDDGTPVRRTPWGEIAWQLGGAEGLAIMAEKDQTGVAPGGDTIERLFNQVNRPILILMDEVMSYVSRYRDSGLGSQMYHFVNTLTEEARSHDNVVVAVAVPASELEMSSQDWDDYNRLMKVLDRLAKAELVTAESDIAEIIRRRLFEWEERVVDQRGKVLLTADAIATCNAYGAWVQANRQLLPSWFAIDQAAEVFKSTYPFHPMLLSVFERKWQALPNFQRTRGILRLLALWVAQAHKDAYRGARQDPLITLGTAPLDDPLFRAAVFKQLNEDRLETAVTTDICGARSSHATRLDEDANGVIRKARLHRQVSTTIFFESNGGQGKTRAYASVPEIRLAVGGPDMDVGNVETVLEALAPPDGACFFMDVTNNRFWFSVVPNLTQILADRKAAVSGDQRIEEVVRQEVQKQFGRVNGINTVFFPSDSGRIPNQPALTVVVLPPERSLQDQDATLGLMERWTREYGSSARTYKSALIWAVPDSPARLREAAQKLLAWQSISDDQASLQLSDTQIVQLGRNLGKAHTDLKEAVWQSYGRVYLLGKDNKLRSLAIGPTNSSAAADLQTLILRELRKYGDVEVSISPNFLVRHWPPAFVEWSTRALADAFFASPLFPRLLDVAAVRETVAGGVANGIMGYVGKAADGAYRPFYFKENLAVADVEITEDMYVITAETAERYVERSRRRTKKVLISPQQIELSPGSQQVFSVQCFDQDEKPVVPADLAWSASGGSVDDRGLYQASTNEGAYTVTVTADGISDSAMIVVRAGVVVPPPPPPSLRSNTLVWTGVIPSQKWVNFYMKVLTKIANGSDLKLALRAEATNSQGISQQKVDEIRAALRELGLDDNVEVL